MAGKRPRRDCPGDQGRKEEKLSAWRQRRIESGRERIRVCPP